MSEILLNLMNVSLSVIKDDKSISILRHINCAFERNQIVGLIGESGAGKSQLGLTIMGMIPAGGQCTGSIIFQGVDLLRSNSFAQHRGRHIALIPQNPTLALNPFLPIQIQMIEILHVHQNYSYTQAFDAVIEMLEFVQLEDIPRILKSYPHELSGGMKQRIVLAMGLLPKPLFLIADEPTTQLDALVQQEILTLLQKTHKTFSTTILLITHDMDVLKICHEVCVMNHGMIVEHGHYHDIADQPQHPYTQNLMLSNHQFNCFRPDFDSFVTTHMKYKEF